MGTSARVIADVHSLVIFVAVSMAIERAVLRLSLASGLPDGVIHRLQTALESVFSWRATLFASQQTVGTVAKVAYCVATDAESESCHGFTVITDAHSVATEGSRALRHGKSVTRHTWTLSRRAKSVGKNVILTAMTGEMMTLKGRSVHALLRKPAGEGVHATLQTVRELRRIIQPTQAL